MFKKLMVTALLVCSLPVAASASWMFSTWAKSTGGSITSDNKLTPQVVQDSAIMRKYTTVGPLTATINASTGYTISKIAFGNFTSSGTQTLTVLDTNPLVATLATGLLTYPVTVPASTTNKVLYAWFKANGLTVTATGGTGATASPAKLDNVIVGTKLTVPFTFRFVAKPGYKVGAISIDAASTCTKSPTVPLPKNNPVIVNAQVAGETGTLTLPAGFVFDGSLIINSAAGSLSGLQATISPSRTVVLPASSTTISGTSLNATYTKWSSVSRPATATQPFNAGAGTINNTSTSPSFIPSVEGLYKFMFIVGDANTRKTLVTTITATTSVVRSVYNQCIACHNQTKVGQLTYSSNHHVYSPPKLNAFNAWSSSAHKNVLTCAGCHVGANSGGHPGSISSTTCVPCHAGASAALVPTVGDTESQRNTKMNAAHQALAGTSGQTCTSCHAINQNAGQGFVQDNNGVRAITAEFEKWSHHVTGVAVNDGQCVACHLEGKVVGTAVVVDPAYHMKGANTYLRNADTDAPIIWNPEAPNHSGMDTFCMSCHDANGATSPGSIAIQGWLNADVSRKAPGKTASAGNPFGDTISNDYDFEERPAVVNASSQFNTTNNSHHAVKGKKYSGRTRTGSVRVIANAATFAANSTAAMPGVRSTIYDSVKSAAAVQGANAFVKRFESLYITLSDNNTAEADPRNGGSTLGDDSTLHCADCHTVGQFAARGSVAYGNMSAAYWTQSGGNAGLSRYNKEAIGAHGSANEYMLRNSIGTDARHQGAEYTGVVTMGEGTKPYLVCFNCHAFNAYGTIVGSGEGAKNHAGDYANNERCNGPFNTVFGNMTGETRLRSMVTTTTAVNTAGIGVGATAANKTGGLPGGGYGNFVGAGKFFGNIYGIQCANCHNSGSKDNIYGGIHGSGVDQTYTDGMGNTSKHFRFMPGLGNIAFVPGVKGGFTGGTLATYKAYSGSRDGSNTTGTGDTGGAYGTANQSFKLLPVRTIRYTATETTKGSYQYVTGGSSNDLNWEQRVQQSIPGQVDLQSQAAGCYTLTPPTGNYTYSTGAESIAAFSPANVAAMKLTISVQPLGQQSNPKVFYPSVYQTDGAAADIRDAATTGFTNAEGHQLFDAWGGCDDHNGAAGAGTGITRKVLRPVSY